MPNKRSAIKAMAVSARRRLRNRSTISAVKTHLRNAERQISAGDPEAARPLVVQAQRAFDKAAEKGIIHPNNAARHKARMMRKLNSIAPAAAPAEKAPARRRTTSRTATARTATKAAGTRTRKTTTTSRTQRAEAAEKKAPVTTTRRRATTAARTTTTTTTTTAASATKPATSRTTARKTKKDDEKKED